VAIFVVGLVLTLTALWPSGYAQGLLLNLGSEFMGIAVAVLVITGWLDGAIRRADQARKVQTRAPATAYALERLERVLSEQEIYGILAFFRPPAWSRDLELYDEHEPGIRAVVEGFGRQPDEVNETERLLRWGQVLSYRRIMHHFGQVNLIDAAEFVRDREKCSDQRLQQWLTMWVTQIPLWRQDVISSITTLERFEKYSDVNPVRLPFAKGVQPDDGFLRDSGFWEIFEHARRLLFAIDQLRDRFPGDHWDVVAETDDLKSFIDGGSGRNR
jgi:hypothetical protein